MRKLVVIGLGLIGGSLAAALKKRGQAIEIIAVARRQETIDTALTMGIIDRGVNALSGIANELGEGDCIFVAVPTLSVADQLISAHALVANSVTLTDGASTKGNIITSLEEKLGFLPENYVPGHPIAGSEQSGVTAANPSLYEQHRVILTPHCENQHCDLVKDLWESVGAEVLTMSVQEHDEVLAATSHLPHVIAYSLVDTLAHDSHNENLFRYAAGGFKDFTRIASSDPTMWHDIMIANKQSVLNAIALFQNNLSQLTTAINNEDHAHLLGVFTRAKAARDRFIKQLNKSSYIDPMTQTLQYIIQPGGSVTGNLRVPGDKSISHRSIMLGSLADGVTEVSGILEGEDALATLQAFRDMGVVIEGPENGKLTIHGVGMKGLKAPPGPLYVGNAGTAMRLLAGLLAGQNFSATLTGDNSLTKRPMNRVANPLRDMGITVETAESGRPPITIHGSQSLKAITYKTPMASAQVKSCVLLAGLYAKGTTKVIEPAVTRDHTERMLKGFGYKVQRDDNSVWLEGGGRLKAMSIEVPADISSAAFFMVAASIAPGSDITLEHVGINPTRTGVIDILRLMGADITLLNEREVGGEPVADIRVRYSELTGITIPEDLVPLAIDEFPVLFIAAACAKGSTVLTGASELRVKESDRIQVMAEGLQTLGIDATPTADGMIVKGGQLTTGTIETHDDHRIAMAFSVAGLRASGPITINNCAHVATSFPGFEDLAKKAGISLERQSI